MATTALTTLKVLINNQQKLNKELALTILNNFLSASTKTKLQKDLTDIATTIWMVNENKVDEIKLKSIINNAIDRRASK